MIAVEEVNTPGFGGYVLAIVISWVAFWIFLGDVDSGTMTGDAMIAVVVYTLLYGGPVAGIGAVVVHLLCRDRRQQWVHVLAAAGAGFVVPVVLTFLVYPAVLLDGGFLFFFLAPIAFAAAIGRAAVIPLVYARRREDDRLRRMSGPPGLQRS